MNELLADIGTAAEVAAVLHTTEAGLAQQRLRGRGPRFIKAGRKVLYRWSDVRAYLDANVEQDTSARGHGHSA